MKRTLFIALISTTLFVQCNKEDNRFLVAENRVGPITTTTTVSQLDSIFEQDSIVRPEKQSNLLSTGSAIQIYEKGGKHLLTLTPASKNNPDAVIEHIQVFDARYQTEKGLHLMSTFKDVKDNYAIAAIQNTLNNVIVTLKDSDIYITIDKEQLPEELRFGSSNVIEKTQIPDKATFKYFMVSWNE